MAAFQSVVDDYVKNVKRVIQNPHSQIVNFRTSRKAEQIKFWTPAMEERYSEVKKEGKLEEYYFGYNEAHSTHDTMENRFVKYTLQSIGKRLSSVITTVLSSSQEELSERHRQMWTDYQDSLRNFRNTLLQNSRSFRWYKTRQSCTAKPIRLSANLQGLVEIETRN